MKFAASIAVLLLGVIIAFQVALALGAPWGKAAWGGQHSGVLPIRFRIASGFAALVIYPLIIAAILDAAGLVRLDVFPWTNGRMTMWILSGFFLLGALANLVSRSKPERWWSPVALTIAICCFVTATAL